MNEKENICFTDTSKDGVALHERRDSVIGARLHFELPSRFCLSPNAVNRHVMLRARAVTFFVTALGYRRFAYDFRMQNRNSKSSKAGLLDFRTCPI